MAAMWIYSFVAFAFIFLSALALPEQGTWEFKYDKINGTIYIGISKSMYSTAKSFVQVQCDHEDHTDITLAVSWVMRRTPCAQEYVYLGQNQTTLRFYHELPEGGFINDVYKDVTYIRSPVYHFKCTEAFTLPNLSDTVWNTTATFSLVGGDESIDENSDLSQEQPNSNKGAEANKKEGDSVEKSHQRRKRGSAEPDDLAPQQTSQLDSSVVPDSAKSSQPQMGTGEDESHVLDNTKSPKSTEASVKSPSTNKNTKGLIVTVPKDGIYLLVLKIEEVGSIKPYTISATVKMRGDYGFLSAIDWPMLPFYGVMCVVYVIYAVAWLGISAWQWKDLLRIQFWIGGVIALGLLEKAIFYAEYRNINSRGYSIYGAVVFAELVSVLKRTMSRMLVIIVSLGFGIVKPRLGQTLHRVLGVGALYFVLGSIEACMRAVRPRLDLSNEIMLAIIPLSVVDAVICWWVFSSLVQTTRTLRLRRNVVKLSLYRHFTNTLVFAVLASIAFMIWSIKVHQLSDCLSDWKELWIDDAFWPLLFTIILLVIMILWTPTANNQRYAFSPLLDNPDDESEEPMLNDAFDGMKMRGVDKSPNGSTSTNTSSRKHGDRVRSDKFEDDLKWVDENIPSSVADAALPTFLDSDEEIMTTKFEMSKME
ncbi:PREDICTED: transmembrane protein 87A-like [Priapulus caudatus]|uniref:Transmembrane protein 87A-like n=1 Tax=Priapulus caudatus TaxID=37621 RepID=A0ABM1ECF3_PRICU|nr:PREDICTED: transmembrane protein 87A-like [Priapulus caudatus]